MQHFEYKDDKSSKFWEIELTETSVTTTWGRIGSSGQTVTKQCASEQKAKELYDKLVQEKSGKGYVEV